MPTSHLLDEATLEQQEPLRPVKPRENNKKRKKLPRDSDSEHSSSGDCSFGSDAGSDAGSWASCDSGEWNRPQPHDTVRIRGTSNVYGVVEEPDYNTMEWCDQHAEDNDIKVAEIGDATESDTDEDEEFLNVYMSLPLPYSQVSAEQYMATIAADSPKPADIKGDVLVGDDLSLRRVRTFSEKKMEIVDRAVNCGIVHTTAEGESGITVNARIQALVSPVCFTNGGQPPEQSPSFKSMSLKQHTTQDKKAKKKNSSTTSSAAAAAPKFLTFVDKDYSTYSMKQHRRHRDFTDVDLKGLKSAMAKASSSKKRGDDDVDAPRQDPPAFCEWVKAADDFIGDKLKPYRIIGEQFVVTNPFRTGAVVLYDGPRSEDPSIDAGNEVDSEYLDDESNFGFVKTCASHVVLQLYPEMSDSAVASDAPVPNAKTPKASKDTLQLDGCYLTEPQTPIIVVLDGDDVIDLNFDILSTDRAKSGRLGNARDEDDIPRNKVFPSYVDPISPGHVIENISTEFIERQATFVYGTSGDILLQRPDKAPSVGKKGGASRRLPKKYEGVRLSAVVVMSYPSRVQVMNEVTGAEREFSPWELLLLESFRADNCMVGRVGFVLDVEAPFAGTTMHDGCVELQVETRMGRGTGQAPEKMVGKKTAPIDDDKSSSSSSSSCSNASSSSDAEDATEDDEPVEAPAATAAAAATSSVGVKAPKVRKERRVVKETSIGTLLDIQEHRKSIAKFIPFRRKVEAEREAFVTRHCTNSTWVPKFGTNYVVGCCLNSCDAARQYYTDVGINFTMEEDFFYRKVENINTPQAHEKKRVFWGKKLQQLMPHVHRLASINATTSTLDLILRDGRMMYDVPAPRLLESKRNEDVDHDFFPMDLVIPSTMRFSAMPISWKPLERGGEGAESGGGAEVDEQNRPLAYEAVDDELVAGGRHNHHHQGDSSAENEFADGPTVCGFVDRGCAVYDAELLYDYEMELQTSEIVYVRRRNDAFFVENDLKTINGDPGVGTKWYEKDSPSVIGMVLSCDTDDQVCDIRWVKQEPDLDCCRLRYGHMCGEVVELLPSTKVRVMWQDGTLADMWRGELSSVNDLEDGGEDDEEFGDDSYDDYNSDDELATDEDVPACDLAEADGEPAKAAEGGASLLQKATDVIGRLAGHFGGASGSKKPSADGDSSSDEDKPEGVPAAASSHEDDLPSGDDNDATAAPASSDACGTFTMCSMFSAHRFRDNEEASTSVTTAAVNAASRVKRIQKEWKNLRSENLPPGVIVKVCEDDVNVLKFALVGPIHTPYYQSLLCFDLLFPADFPFSPPKVHFHSFGLKLNPNLYENGHICLSLLGTWTGEDSSEGWMPATSTVLQVIISIHSLVLVKEPFYNEAGFDEKRGSLAGREMSKTFNEALQQKRLQHMIITARTPVPDWTYETRKHFVEFAPKVTARLNRVVSATAADAKAATSSSAAITADGLVLPVSKGVAKALQPLLTALVSTHETLAAQWEAERKKDEEYMRSDDDDEDEAAKA